MFSVLLSLLLLQCVSSKSLESSQLFQAAERDTEDCEESPNCPVLARNFGCEDPRGLIRDMCHCSCSAALLEEKEEGEEGVTSEKRELGEEEEEMRVREEEEMRMREEGEEIEERDEEEQFMIDRRNQCQENSNCPQFITNFGCDDPRGLIKKICSCSCSVQSQTNDIYYSDNNIDSGLGISTEEQIMLEEHNLRRRRHNVPDLQYDTDLARTSGEWCRHLATTDTWEHSDQTNAVEGYGENLYYSFGMPVSKVPAKAVKVWYDEIELYDFNNPGFSAPTGHFTQVVWRDTTKVGCAVTDPDLNVKRKSYACCQYLPPGNWQGEFEENVPRPRY